MAPDLHPYGACYHDLAEKLSTGVIEFLRCNDVTTVIVGGLATDFCVATTARQLQQTGRFKVILHLDACRGIAPDGTEARIRSLQESGVVIADTIDDVKKAIAA